MVDRKIAIILARGGSKRLPRKNILDFCGKPMLAWTVLAAVQSEQFDRVLVSTDDEEIADVGKKYGAEVPFLRLNAADDVSTSSQATLVALGQAEKYWHEEYETVAQLMANCPLRDDNDVRAAMTNFDQCSADSQISCFRFGWMNPWWAIKLNALGEAEMLHQEVLEARSQDLPPLYCPTGAFWVARSRALKAAGTYYTPNRIYHPMDWLSAMDIDDTEDLQMAKACYLVKNERLCSKKC